MRVVTAATGGVVRAMRMMRVMALMRVVTELGRRRLTIGQCQERRWGDLDRPGDRGLSPTDAEPRVGDLRLSRLRKDPGKGYAERRNQDGSLLHRAGNVSAVQEMSSKLLE